jgi:hypothetical protein
MCLQTYFQMPLCANQERTLEPQKWQECAPQTRLQARCCAAVHWQAPRAVHAGRQAAGALVCQPQVSEIGGALTKVCAPQRANIAASIKQATAF